MLPDFPKTKTLIASRFDDFLRARKEMYLGPLSKIRVRRVPEGNVQEIVRTSGEIEEIDVKTLRSTFVVADDELPTLSIETILVKLDSVAQQIAKQQAEQTYTAIAKAVEEVGNSVDAKGDFGAESILELLARLEIQFSPDGRPRLPEIHVHPSQAEAIVAALKELEADRDLRERFEQIMVLKREEWRAREALRKLVG